MLVLTLKAIWKGKKGNKKGPNRVKMHPPPKYIFAFAFSYECWAVACDSSEEV